MRLVRKIDSLGMAEMPVVVASAEMWKSNSSTKPQFSNALLPVDLSYHDNHVQASSKSIGNSTSDSSNCNAKS